MARQAILTGRGPTYLNETFSSDGAVLGGPYLDQSVQVAVTITPSVGTATITGQAPTVTTTNVAVQDGIAVGPSVNCYEGLVHWRAGMGTSGLDAILYTGPPS